MNDGVPRPSDTEFRALALPLLEDIARFARSLTRDPMEADDVVQETFLQAYRGWHTFRPGSDCRGWLFTICRHEFLRTRRKRALTHERLEGDDDATATALEHAAAVRDGLGDLLDRIDVGPAIRRAVDALGEPHHSILVLVDLEQLSYEEAGRMLDIPPGTVRSRLYRARRQVQRTLIEHARDMGLGSPARAPSAVPLPSEEHA